MSSCLVNTVQLNTNAYRQLLIAFVSKCFMVGKLKIGKIKFTFVFRHKWDNQDEIRYNSEFRDYRIGIWFKRSKIVGSKNFSKPKEWGNNLVNDYMIGMNLIIFKIWVSFNRGGMTL